MNKGEIKIILNTAEIDKITHEVKFSNLYFYKLLY